MNGMLSSDISTCNLQKISSPISHRQSTKAVEKSASLISTLSSSLVDGADTVQLRREIRHQYKEVRIRRISREKEGDHTKRSSLHSAEIEDTLTSSDPAFFKLSKSSQTRKLMPPMEVSAELAECFAAQHGSGPKTDTWTERRPTILTVSEDEITGVIRKAPNDSANGIHGRN